MLENPKAPKSRPNHAFSWIRNWTVHNMISHPLMEIAFWVLFPFGRERADRVSNWIHDISIPKEV